MPRALPSLAAVLLLLATALPAGAAEEVFVLDNGMVLRGVEVRRAGEEVVIRLTDLGSDARVTVALARIVRRYGFEEGVSPPPPMEALLHATDRAPPVAALPPRATPSAVCRLAPCEVTPLPLEDPSPRQETYLDRLERLTRMALPGDPVLQAALVLLGFSRARAAGADRWAPARDPGVGRAQGAAARGGLRRRAGGAGARPRQPAARGPRPVGAPGPGRRLPRPGWWLLRGPPRRALLLVAFLCFSVSVVVFASGAVLMIC